MAINFVSIGIQDIGHYCLPCKNTDLFVRLEEKLNNDFPQLKDYQTVTGKIDIKVDDIVKSFKVDF